MKTILFGFALFFATSAFGAIVEFRLCVVDMLGEPVVGAKVHITGKSKQITDSLGYAVFTNVAPKELSIEITKDEHFYDLRRTVDLTNGATNKKLTLEWSKIGWRHALSQLGIREKAARDSILSATDFTGFVDCLDSTGESMYLEATFFGGVSLMQAFIVTQIDYPEESIDMEEQGRVELSFVVEANGFITKIEVDKSVSPALDAEAVRVIQLMSAYFVPASCNGNYVRTRVHCPIVFTLY